MVLYAFVYGPFASFIGDPVPELVAGSLTVRLTMIGVVGYA